MDLGLTKPMIVAKSGPAVLLTEGGALDDADAQTWSPTEGYSEVKPLQVWLKFLYYLEEVDPPEPWEDPSS